MKICPHTHHVECDNQKLDTFLESTKEEFDKMILHLYTDATTLTGSDTPKSTCPIVNQEFLETLVPEYKDDVQMFVDQGFISESPFIASNAVFRTRFLSDVLDHFEPLFDMDQLYPFFQSFSELKRFLLFATQMSGRSEFFKDYTMGISEDCLTYLYTTLTHIGFMTDNFRITMHHEGHDIQLDCLANIWVSLMNGPLYMKKIKMEHDRLSHQKELQKTQQIVQSLVGEILY